jgi:hypothetical protein
MYEYRGEFIEETTAAELAEKWDRFRAVMREAMIADQGDRFEDWDLEAWLEDITHGEFDFAAFVAGNPSALDTVLDNLDQAYESINASWTDFAALSGELDEWDTRTAEDFRIRYMGKFPEANLNQLEVIEELISITGAYRELIYRVRYDAAAILDSAIVACENFEPSDGASSWNSFLTTASVLAGVAGADRRARRCGRSAVGYADAARNVNSTRAPRTGVVTGVSYISGAAAQQWSDLFDVLQGRLAEVRNDLVATGDILCDIAEAYARADLMAPTSSTSRRTACSRTSCYRSTNPPTTATWTRSPRTSRRRPSPTARWVPSIPPAATTNLDRPRAAALPTVPRPPRALSTQRARPCPESWLASTARAPRSRATNQRVS